MISRLIKLEWTKFRKNNVIVLLSIFFLVFFPMSVFVGDLIPEKLPAFIPSRNNFYQFIEGQLNVWDFLGYAGSWMVFFFLGMIVIYTFTTEVSNKTLRQSIINGMTRNHFFASKILNIFLLSIIATLLYTIICMSLGFYNTEDATLSLALANEYAIPRFFLMSINYLSFAFMLAILLRKSGLAVFTYISYVLIIESLLRLGASQYIYSGPWVNYFPLNATEDLMPAPWSNLADSAPSGVDFDFWLSYKQAAITTFISTLIFLSISYFNFQKRDI